MADSSLVDYIKTHLSAGYPIEQIRQSLLESDWPEDEITAAINLVTQKGAAPTPSTPSTYKEPKKFSKLLIISVLLIFVVIGSIFAIFMFREEKPSLELDIKIPKLTYEVGELFSGGEYYMKYDGALFNGIVLYAYSREGFEKVYSSFARGIIEDVDFEIPDKTRYLKHALRAFKLNEYGYASSTDYFYDEGKYTYYISVYDCSNVEKALQKDCKDFTIEDAQAIANIQPLKTASKDIIVVSGKVVSECKTSDNCNEICKGCKIGKQICEQTSEKCMDCFTDFQCKEGYECERNTCVKKIPLLAEEEPVKEIELPPEEPAVGVELVDCKTDSDCFEKKFSDCVPATLTLKFTETIIYYYKILGPKEGACEIKSKFLANPNQDWVGKEMTCKYDNTKDFTSAVQDMSRCKGPLYNLFI